MQMFGGYLAHFSEETLFEYSEKDLRENNIGSLGANIFPQPGGTT